MSVQVQATVTRALTVPVQFELEDAEEDAYVTALSRGDRQAAEKVIADVAAEVAMDWPEVTDEHDDVEIDEIVVATRRAS